MNINGMANRDRIAASFGEKDQPVQMSVKKGDVIEGVVTSVQDKISIDFNGKEMQVPKSAVQDAREGKKVCFQIMDVSNNRIVLKAMENGGNKASKMVFTTALTGSATVSLEQSKSRMGADSNEYNQIKNATTEDIYDVAVSEDGVYMTVEEYTLEAFDRLLETINEIKQMQTDALLAQADKIQSMREAIDRANLKNRLPQGVSSALARYFVQYDIALTDDRLESIGVALGQYKSVTGLDDKVIAGLLRNEQVISISNIYNMIHSGSVVSGGVSDDVYESMKPQIEKLVTSLGYTWDHLQQENTRWLIRNEIPVNEDTLRIQKELFRIRDKGFDDDKVLENIVKGIADGMEASHVSILSDDDRIRETIGGIRNITDRDINSVIARGERMTLGNLFAAKLLEGNSEIKQEWPEEEAAKDARIQIEEIRLRMTLQAARTLEGKDIDIRTRELSTLVEDLKQLEYDKIKNNLAGTYPDISPAEIDTVITTENYRYDISRAPSYLIAEVSEDGMKSDLEHYHTKAVALTESVRRAEGAYEKVMTSPRADMGDSIAKAFRNIDELLENSGIPVTDENRRITKILAHNNMAITKENIDNLKDYDVKMQYILNNLKPETTLEIIRQGVNPLDIPLEELGERITAINNENSDKTLAGDETSYSRFLWKLEKENRINEDEREAYIGICRLIYQVSKNDTGVLGAVYNADLDLNLRNLLTVSRSLKHSISAEIDDEHGMAGSGQDTREIEGQIMKGFDQTLVSKLKDSITPSKLYDMSQGDPERLYDEPLENLLDNIRHLEENKEIEEAYMNELTEKLRKTPDMENAMKLLDSLDIDKTIFTINMAQKAASEGQNYLKNIFKEADDDLKDEIEKELDLLADSFDNEISADSRYEKLSDIAREILEGKEKGVISSKDLTTLRTYNEGIRMSRLFSKKRYYEVPVLTENGLTNMNLTIVSSDKERGSVNIRMNSEKAGNINLEFTVKGDRVQCLMLTEKNISELSEINEEIKEMVNSSGFDLISFNNASHNVKGAYIPDMKSSASSDTSRLYRLSKNVVKLLSAKIKEETL